MNLAPIQLPRSIFGLTRTQRSTLSTGPAYNAFGRPAQGQGGLEVPLSKPLP